jgi:hypothetical protein
MSKMANYALELEENMGEKLTATVTQDCKAGIEALNNYWKLQQQNEKLVDMVKEMLWIVPYSATAQIDIYDKAQALLTEITNG